MRKARVIVMSLLIVLLAAGSVVEKYHGNQHATEVIYGSWWFILLLGLVGAGAIYFIVKDKLWKRIELLLVYGSIPIILTGGGLTMWTGEHGSIKLQPGVPNNSFTDKRDTTQMRTLPFSITLDEFKVVPYPGTMTPMDFESHVRIDGESYIISMNNILKKRGYRFYQEDYDEEGNSVLSVAHDPWGIGVTYAGYIIMTLGLIGMFASKRSTFRKLLKAAAMIAAMCCTLAGWSATTPHTLPQHEAHKMGEMYIFYKGRICPLQTFAKDFTTKLYGNATYRGLTAEQVLSGWMFYYSEWQYEPMIKVKGSEVQQLLGLSGRYASMNDFSDSYGKDILKAVLDTLPAMSPKAKNYKTANEKANIIRMLTGGTMMKLFPHEDERGKMKWFAQNDKLPSSIEDDEYLFITQCINYCTELAITGRYEELNQLFEKTRKYQEEHAKGMMPSQSQLRAERIYNGLTTGRWLAMTSITLGLLCFAISLIRQSKAGEKNKFDKLFRLITLVLVIVSTCFLLLIFIMKWIAGGHVPMTGGFDSMNLMAIAIGIIVVATSRRIQMAPSIGLLTIGFCLLVAMMSGANPPITHLMPVLRSPLLSLHVTVIMIAYALFFFVMMISLAGMLTPSRRAELARVGRLMLYPAETLLAVGIMIGAVWANISWGNYWSWDPKEVWALITLIVYSIPLMCQDENNSQYSGFGFHLYCFIAFLSVIITYFGVNFILGGIHAYN